MGARVSSPQRRRCVKCRLLVPSRGEIACRRDLRVGMGRHRRRTARGKRRDTRTDNLERIKAAQARSFSPTEPRRRRRNRAPNRDRRAVETRSGAGVSKKLPLAHGAGKDAQSESGKEDRTSLKHGPKSLEISARKTVDSDSRSVHRRALSLRRCERRLSTARRQHRFLLCSRSRGRRARVLPALCRKAAV